uniref:Uncharacterized protein n=1 Tax=Oryza brachyantha TaxID=4533 RepID=J3MYG2_ORYBR
MVIAVSSVPPPVARRAGRGRHIAAGTATWLCSCPRRVFALSAGSGDVDRADAGWPPVSRGCRRNVCHQCCPYSYSDFTFENILFIYRHIFIRIWNEEKYQWLFGSGTFP